MEQNSDKTGMNEKMVISSKQEKHLPDVSCIQDFLILSFIFQGKLTPYLFFCISSIALASFPAGFQIGCINAPGPLIIEWIKQCHFELFGETLSQYKADFIWRVPC